MFHARLVILESPRREISDEKIKVGMTLFLKHEPPLLRDFRDRFSCK
jgi:hypothetical protein